MPARAAAELQGAAGHAQTRGGRDLTARAPAQAHKCDGMKGCKEAAFNRNAAKLENERCIAPKV